MGCFATIKHELFHASMYDLSVPTDSSEITAVAATNKMMNIDETFAPRPHLFFVGVKLVLAVWLFVTMVISILENEPYYGFWFAYLSSWVMIFTVMYAICSFISAALLAYRRPLERRKTELTGKIGMLLKITWTLFAVTFPAALVVTLLFWFLVFDGTLKYTSFMLHGISWIIVGIDGILINRIPLRIKQFIFLETFSILYLVWSILHSALNVGNPWNNNEGENQPIYDTVDWENGTGFAIGLAVVLLFAGLPIIFMLCRALSLSLPMRCRNNDVCEAFNDEESLEMPTRDS